MIFIVKKLYQNLTRTIELVSAGPISHNINCRTFLSSSMFSSFDWNVVCSSSRDMIVQTAEVRRDQRSYIFINLLQFVAIQSWASLAMCAGVPSCGYCGRLFWWEGKTEFHSRRILCWNKVAGTFIRLKNLICHLASSFSRMAVRLFDV